MTNYVKVQCPCGRVNRVPIEDEVFKRSHRPETLGAQNCPVCNRRNVSYVIVNHVEQSAGSHKGIHYVD